MKPIGEKESFLLDGNSKFHVRCLEGMVQMKVLFIEGNGISHSATFWRKIDALRNSTDKTVNNNVSYRNFNRAPHALDEESFDFIFIDHEESETILRPIIEGIKRMERQPREVVFFSKKSLGNKMIDAFMLEMQLDGITTRVLPLEEVNFSLVREKVGGVEKRKKGKEKEENAIRN